MSKKLKEVIKILMFIRGMTAKDIVDKCSFSYTALMNYLNYHSSMKIDNLQQIFQALNFDMIKAMSIVENVKDFNFSRLSIIKELIEEYENEN